MMSASAQTSSMSFTPVRSLYLTAESGYLNG